MLRNGNSTEIRFVDDMLIHAPDLQNAPQNSTWLVTNVYAKLRQGFFVCSQRDPALTHFDDEERLIIVEDGSGRGGWAIVAGHRIELSQGLLHIVKLDKET